MLKNNLRQQSPAAMQTARYLQEEMVFLDNLALEPQSQLIRELAQANTPLVRSPVAVREGDDIQLDVPRSGDQINLNADDLPEIDLNAKVADDDIKAKDL